MLRYYWASQNFGELQEGSLAESYRGRALKAGGTRYGHCNSYVGVPSTRNLTFIIFYAFYLTSKTKARYYIAFKDFWEN